MKTGPRWRILCISWRIHQSRGKTVSLLRPGLTRISWIIPLYYLAGSWAPYIHVILSDIVSITWYITQPLISNAAADYQSISQHDIICTGMNCTMIWYNSYSECSVVNQNISHMILFQQCHHSLNFISSLSVSWSFHHLSWCPLEPDHHPPSLKLYLGEEGQCLAYMSPSGHNFKQLILTWNICPLKIKTQHVIL